MVQEAIEYLGLRADAQVIEIGFGCAITLHRRIGADGAHKSKFVFERSVDDAVVCDARIRLPHQRIASLPQCGGRRVLPSRCRVRSASSASEVSGNSTA